MKVGEITINEQWCKGCNLCVVFCARKCISAGRKKSNDQGYIVPDFTAPQNCNACAVCSWMCPDFAITVYEITED